MHAADLWHSPSLGPRALRTALTPLSWLYAGGWQAYLALYRFGFKRAKEPHRPVVCVGNLTTGGSGKTPTTLHLAEVLRESGFPVVVSGSGYGSPRSEAATLAPAGELDAREWGDEAAMLRWFRPDLPLIVGRNRVRAAEIAHSEFRGAVLLLDDGFQHLPLKKHLTIVLEEETPPNRRCLPAGPYREPRSNLRRADIVLPRDFAILWNLAGPVDPASRAPIAPPPGPIQLLSAIGNPERLSNSLIERGFEIARQWRLADHDPLAQGNLLASVDPALPLVVTAKDWVKLRRRPDWNAFKIGVVWNEARIEPVASFRQRLDASLAQIQ